MDRAAARLPGRVLVLPAAPAPGRRRSSGAVDHELDAYLHLAALNRGVLLTPFHNMALVCSSHTADDVDRHTAVFAEAVAAIRADRARKTAC